MPAANNRLCAGGALTEVKSSAVHIPALYPADGILCPATFFFKAMCAYQGSFILYGYKNGS
jgi:hypothetical protein